MKVFLILLFTVFMPFQVQANTGDLIPTGSPSIEKEKIHRIVATISAPALSVSAKTTLEANQQTNMGIYSNILYNSLVDIGAKIVDRFLAIMGYIYRSDFMQVGAPLIFTIALATLVMKFTIGGSQDPISGGLVGSLFPNKISLSHLGVNIGLITIFLMVLLKPVPVIDSTRHEVSRLPYLITVIIDAADKLIVYTKVDSKEMKQIPVSDAEDRALYANLETQTLDYKNYENNIYGLNLGNFMNLMVVKPFILQGDLQKDIPAGYKDPITGGHFSLAYAWLKSQNRIEHTPVFDESLYNIPSVAPIVWSNISSSLFGGSFHTTAGSSVSEGLFGQPFQKVLNNPQLSVHTVKGDLDSLIMALSHGASHSKSWLGLQVFGTWRYQKSGMLQDYISSINNSKSHLRLIRNANAEKVSDALLTQEQIIYGITRNPAAAKIWNSSLNQLHVPEGYSIHIFSDAKKTMKPLYPSGNSNYFYKVLENKNFGTYNTSVGKAQNIYEKLYSVKPAEWNAWLKNISKLSTNLKLSIVCQNVASSSSVPAEEYRRAIKANTSIDVYKRCLNALKTSQSPILQSWVDNRVNNDYSKMNLNNHFSHSQAFPKSVYRETDRFGFLKISKEKGTFDKIKTAVMKGDLTGGLDIKGAFEKGVLFLVSSVLMLIFFMAAIVIEFIVAGMIIIYPVFMGWDMMKGDMGEATHTLYKYIGGLFALILIATIISIVGKGVI